jgi:tetratricopeptide (TPR) repeat protein
VSLHQEKTDEGIRLLSDIASIRIQQRRIAEALQVLHQAEAFAEALSPPNPKSLGNIYYEYAELYLATGDFPRAESYARRALPRFKGVVYAGIDPYANSLIVLGNALYRQWRTAEAEVVIRELMDRQLQRYGPNHSLVGTTWNNYALILMAQGKYQATEEALLEALRIAQGDSDASQVVIVPSAT